MKIKFWVLSAAILVLASAACKPAKPPQRPNVLGDDSTVYGTPSDGSRPGSGSGEEVISEDPYLYGSENPDGGVQGNTFDIVDDGSRPGGLSWDPIYFELDQALLSEEAKATLRGYADALKRAPGKKVLLEGHCDERGTETYNLALGERRAQVVKRYLIELGVGGDQLQTVSYGELRPLEPGSHETAWARNRRVAFTF